MSLRAKTVAIAVAGVIVTIAVVCAMSELLLMRQFVQLDRENAVRNMQRVLLGLEDRLEFLDATVSDWAWWDDSYAFVQTRDENYVRTNLVGSTFATLGVNIMVFADRSGEIVFIKCFDLEEGKEIPVPQDLLDHLKPSSPLLCHPTPESSVRGILLLSDSVLAVASRPVLSSQKKGSIQGTLVMGSFLDPPALEVLSKAMQTELSLSRFDAMDESQPNDPLYSALESGSIYVTEPNRYTVSAYVLIRDIYDRPALIVKTYMPREVYAHAHAAVGLFLLYISAAGFVSAAVALLFLDKMVLSRLAALKNAAARIGRDVRVSERLPVTSRDEIGELAGAINSMLARIQEGQVALADSEERYRSILEEMQESYLELDLKGNIVFCNDATCQMLKYSSEELLGAHFGKYVHGDEVATICQIAEQMCEADKSSSILSCRFLRGDGTLGYAEIDLYLRRSKDGGMVGFRALARDITERKLAEQQMMTASRLATTGELAAGIAHELNNPLTGIIGYAQLLMARAELSEEVKSDLRKIQSEGQRAARIVRDLLSFARQNQPKKMLVDINEVIKRTLELQSYELMDRDVELEVRLSPGLPRILADYNQIQQVVMNIVINAEQALAESNCHGRIVIETGLREGYVTIAISDNGPGIPENISGRIFQPFFTTKEVGKGTGLGLSVCHGIVTAHGGKIYFQSKPGEGATFFVELPVINSIVV